MGRVIPRHLRYCMHCGHVLLGSLRPLYEYKEPSPFSTLFKRASQKTERVGGLIQEQGCLNSSHHCFVQRLSLRSGNHSECIQQHRG